MQEVTALVGPSGGGKSSKTTRNRALEIIIFYCKSNIIVT